MTTFTGTAGTATFQAIALKRGIKLYAATGMKPNRAWTAKNMRLTAEKITGQKFKARDYAGMIDALDNWIKENGTAG